MPEVSLTLLEEMMDRALIQAHAAFECGEIPVGAVVYCNGEFIAEAHNRTEALNDPTAHAEVLAIREAGGKLANWRLERAILCVTLEPCTMCAGAIRGARVPVVAYGASDERVGAAGSLYDLLEDSRLGPPPRLIRGIREQESSRLLKRFFEEKLR